MAEDSCPFEAVNGVPIAVKDEALAAAKGEPVVAVRVELKWSPTLVRPQILSRDIVTSV